MYKDSRFVGGVNLDGGLYGQSSSEVCKTLSCYSGTSPMVLHPLGSRSGTFELEAGHWDPKLHTYYFYRHTATCRSHIWLTLSHLRYRASWDIFRRACKGCHYCLCGCVHEVCVGRLASASAQRAECWVEDKSVGLCTDPARARILLSWYLTSRCYYSINIKDN